jgi:hypothetical protein
LVGRLVVAQAALFSAKTVFKNCGIAVWCLPSGLGLLSNKIKVRQQIGRKDSMQATCQRMRRLEGFLHEFFSKIQNQNVKILNIWWLTSLPGPIQCYHF